MENNILNISHIGDLQTYELPYVSLFEDRSEKSLYILIRYDLTEKEIINYICFDVKNTSVKDYMKLNKSLYDLIDESIKCMHVEYRIPYFSVVDDKLSKEEAKHIISGDGMFCLEKFFDEVEIQYYI